MCFVSKQRPSQMEGEKGKGERSLAARSEGVEGKKEKRKMMVTSDELAFTGTTIKRGVFFLFSFSRFLLVEL